MAGTVICHSVALAADPCPFMVAKLPVMGPGNTVSGMAWGFNFYLMEADQFRGAYLSVVESVSKLVATHLSTGPLPHLPGVLRSSVGILTVGASRAAALLDADGWNQQSRLSEARTPVRYPTWTIPTNAGFVCFRPYQGGQIVSNEFKGAGHRLISLSWSESGLLPDNVPARRIQAGHFWSVKSALAITTPSCRGVAGGSLFKELPGQQLGVELVPEISADALLMAAAAVVELAGGVSVEAMSTACALLTLGVTTSEYVFSACGERSSLWASGSVGAPARRSSRTARGSDEAVEKISTTGASTRHSLCWSSLIAPRPRVIIPVFPGNSREYDVARAFEHVSTALTPQDII